MRPGRNLRWVAVGALACAACSSGSDTLSGTEASMLISDALEEEVGQRPPQIDCPDEIDAKSGTTFRCTLVADDGSTIGVTATFTDDDGSIDIKVDDELTSPPTTP